MIGLFPGLQIVGVRLRRISLCHTKPNVATKLVMSLSFLLRLLLVIEELRNEVVQGSHRIHMIVDRFRVASQLTAMIEMKMRTIRWQLSTADIEISRRTPHQADGQNE